MGQTSDSALMQLTPFVPLDVFYDVYLAQKGLKPAASFQILVGREREGIGEMALNLKAKVDSIMGQMNMVSKSEIQRSHIRLQYKGSSEWVVFTQINLDYLISPTDEGLDRLISANSLNHGMGLHTKEFYISFGLALGYPAEAVNLFASLMHMGISPGAYDTTCILEAIQKGIEIPSWLPYIPYTLGAAELTEKKSSMSKHAAWRKIQNICAKR